jgi:hypothetical protein
VRFKEASDRYRVLGDVASLMDATGDGGYMTALDGDLVGASKLFNESLNLAVELGARDRISWAILGFGNLAAEIGESARAVRLLAAADAIQKSMQEDLRPAVDTIQNRILEEQRKNLGETAYAGSLEKTVARSCGASIAEARAVITALATRAGVNSVSHPTSIL